MDHSNKDKCYKWFKISIRYGLVARLYGKDAEPLTRPIPIAARLLTKAHKIFATVSGCNLLV